MKRLIEILAAGVTDDDGLVLSSGTVTSYTAGTTTLSTLYQDFDCTDPHPNPATLDDAGRLIAYTSTRIKLVLSDSDGAVVRTIDNVGTSDADITIASTSLSAGDGLLSDASGVWSVNTDNTTVEVNGDQLRVKDAGITGAKLSTTAADASTLEVAGGSMRVKDAGITQAKRAALGQQLSSSCGAFSTTSSSYADVTNLSVTITTTGRPVFVAIIPDGDGTDANASKASYSCTSTDTASILILRDSTYVAHSVIDMNGTTTLLSYFGSYVAIDIPAAGTYTYKVQAKETSSGGTFYLYYMKLIAFEL